jgi:2-polyprenyl-6-hydroxyphenyl methylase/3-demethylubiquinone-9 3-methyltransferase
MMLPDETPPRASTSPTPSLPVDDAMMLPDETPPRVAAYANADPGEIAKFSALAHHWWDPDSTLFGPLHRLNPLRLAWLERAAGGLAGKAVVDVGCGGGILSEAMAGRGARVLGIDVAATPLGVARLHKLESGANVEYRQVAAEVLAAESPAGFDVVTCMEMLEHVPEPASIIAACATLVKPGGTIVISTINRNPKSYLFAVIGAEYVLGLLPRGTHDWARFLKPSEVAAFARHAGLLPDGIAGIGYNPLTKAFFVAADPSVNYLLALRRPGNG